MMGDGECYEGSVWEAALFAGHHRLSNLVLFIDRNGLIATASTEDVNSLGSVSSKLESFGFEVFEIDAHNFEAIYNTLKIIENKDFDKPIAIVANSIKGKGVSFMENQVSWHHGGIKGDNYEKARGELLRLYGGSEVMKKK